MTLSLEAIHELGSATHGGLMTCEWLVDGAAMEVVQHSCDSLYHLSHD